MQVEDIKSELSLIRDRGRRVLSVWHKKKKKTEFIQHTVSPTDSQSRKTRSSANRLPKRGKEMGGGQSRHELFWTRPLRFKPQIDLHEKLEKGKRTEKTVGPKKVRKVNTSIQTVSLHIASNIANERLREGGGRRPSSYLLKDSVHA